MTHKQQSVLTPEEIRIICENSLRDVIKERNPEIWWKEFVEIVGLKDIKDHLFTHTELKICTNSQWSWEEGEGFVFDININKNDLIRETSKNQESFQIPWLQNRHVLQSYSKEEQSGIIRDCFTKGIVRLLKYILSAVLIANPLDFFQEGERDIEENFLKVILGRNYKPNSKLINNNLDEGLKEFKKLTIDCIKKYTQIAKQKWKNVHLYDYDSNNISFANEIIDLIKVVHSRGATELWLGRSIDQKEEDVEFEILADPQNLLLLLNFHDYIELQCNQMRWDYLNKYFQGKIYYIPCMQKGYVRIIDKRALRMRICFKDFLHKNISCDTDWYKVAYDIYTSIFQNFAGCLLVPKNNS